MLLRSERTRVIDSRGYHHSRPETGRGTQNVEMHERGVRGGILKAPSKALPPDFLGEPLEKTLQGRPGLPGALRTVEARGAGFQIPERRVKDDQPWEPDSSGSAAPTGCKINGGQRRDDQGRHVDSAEEPFVDAFSQKPRTAV